MENMELGLVVIAIILICALILLFIQAAFLLLGAHIARIENRTFGRALGTTILGGLASLFISLLLSFVPVIGTVLGFIAGFLVSALIMVPIFKTTFGKALAATVLAWAIGLLVIGGILLLLVLVAGGFAALLL